MKSIFAAFVLFAMLWGTPAQAANENVTIRFGVLPVLDTLPMQVAVQEGFFADAGLNVELVSFASALERDTAMQAGLLDGYFGDLIATCLLVRQGVPMRIALTSYRTTPGSPMFGIAVGSGKAEATLADLRGASIGYSRSTIMEYLLDRISEKYGLAPDYFRRIEVKKIPIRLQMLMDGQLDAAILPEPLMSLVEYKGGAVVLTAEDMDMPLTVLCLHERFFADEGRIYRRFADAYAKAVEHLAETPEKYRGLMARTCRIPPPLAPKYPIYRYPAPALPTAAELDDVQDWMIAHDMLKQRMPHARLLPGNVR
ncbi:ABC transporter substrate-binding protein [Pseudodesulfovibrio senegalensis]|uniref:ABC transporter substrate-binding protein n=1 Tax=Pseudodesulfovibrio senegalensis TaxID=1721087 RepID=A0A6N6N6V6_9BACT|nr:ABC transporter substrate-binding protein [Pseudodesulfovibrio senegalensis]KAB1443458.1 ABC transporter substrate-binding protein [Pseudodesulfovibrio senegalensis]